MCFRNFTISLIFPAFLLVFSGCDAMDTFLTPSNNYKLNARVVNDISLDECSFITENDNIQPYFEKSVSNDPDITALMVFFMNGRGEIVGRKILYSLNDEAGQAETLIPVGSLDDNLPSVPIPSNLSVGRYTMVLQVMRGTEILQKTEKPFYYMGKTGFTYDGINVYLPGIADNSQIIPKGLVILLEAKLDFNGNPYIVWYNGSRKISEGRYSDGANFLLWKAPEESGFYSVSAEIFPSDSYLGLSGYKKEVSLPVSIKTTGFNLVSDSIPQLIHWYTFEGNLNDSLLITSQERSLKTSNNIKSQWLPANGIYGLAAGFDRTYEFPADSGYDNWQTLFRFKPINDGGLFYVRFSSDVFMNVRKEGQSLILTLSSPENTVSQTIRLQAQNAFITAGVSFSVASGLVTAKININGDEQYELNNELLRLDVNIDSNFQIVLGNKQEENTSDRNSPVFTAIWDEFALYKDPPVETILTDVRRAAGFAVSQPNYISSN